MGTAGRRAVVVMVGTALVAVAAVGAGRVWRRVRPPARGTLTMPVGPSPATIVWPDGGPPDPSAPFKIR
jgi:hypothetical protein